MLKKVLCLFFMGILASCSSSQINDAKLSFSEEAGRASEAGFKSIGEKELSSEQYQNLSCDAEAAYYRSKVSSKLKEKLGADESKVVASKSFVGDACKVVLPLALDYAIDQADLKPCARAIGKEKLSGLGDLACAQLDDES